MLGTLGACPIEIMPLEIVELEMTNFDPTSAIFKTLYLALNKIKLKFWGDRGRFGLWGVGGGGGGGYPRASPPCMNACYI